MNDAALEIPKTMPFKDVAFFFLLLFVVNSFGDLRFSALGGGLLSLSNYELCGYLLLLAAGASACASSLRGNAAGSLSDGVHRWLFFYLAWMPVAAFLTGGADGRFMVGDLKMILLGVIGYFSVILMMTSYNKAKLVLYAWTGAGLVNAVLAMSQYFFGGPFPVGISQASNEKLDIGGEVARSHVTGFFGHPNSFSQIVIPYFVVFTMAWLLSGKKFSVKSLMLLFTGLLFGLVLMLTYSKGAILWSGIAIVIGVAASKWGLLRSMPFFIGSWLFCVLGIISLALLIFAGLVELEALSTLFTRIEFMVASFNLFIEHPFRAVFGGGKHFWPEYSAQWSTWEYENAHNVYLNQALMYGFIGLGLLVSFILAHVRRGLKCGINASRPLMSPFPYVIAVFAMTGSYFFEPSFAEPTQKFQLLFMLAMVFALPRIEAPYKVKS
jgi:O-antigen ligase